MDKGLGRRKSWIGVVIFVAVGVLTALGVVLTSGHASASSQQDDPEYTSSPGPNPNNPNPFIVTDAKKYNVGETVKVKACGYTAGTGMSGTITYKGSDKYPVKERGDGCMAPAGGAAPAAGGEFAAADGWIALPVQTDFPSGSFTATPVSSGNVCSVAAEGSPCTDIQIVDEGSRGTARTGFELALYLAIALILLVVGANLVQWSRRRRRRLHREREAAYLKAHRERELINK